jgi:hypothetical protein
MSEMEFSSDSPAFYDEFQCIGSDCSDTCCAGWTISLSKKEHARYKNASSIKVRDIAKTKIQRFRGDGASDKFFSVMQLSESGACNFLDRKGLCVIQSEMGEDALSHTCSMYPRAITEGKNGSGWHYRKSLALSCPEAARLCLETATSISLSEVTMSADRPFLKKNYGVGSTGGLEESEYSAIERVMLGFSQNKEWSTLQKYLGLTVFLRQLEASAPAGLAAVQGINVFNASKITNDAISTMETPLRTEDQMLVLVQFVRACFDAARLLAKDGRENKFTGFLSSAHDNLKDEDGTESLSVDKFESGLECVDNLILEAPFLRDNFISSELMRKLRMCANFADIHKCIERVMVDWSIIRFVLACNVISIMDQKEKKDMLVAIVAATCRAFEHNATLWDQIFSSLGDSSEARSAKVGLLLT